VLIAGVRELIVVWGEFLEALCSDGAEVPGEVGELGKHDAAAGHEAVDQRLLPHSCQIAGQRAAPVASGERICCFLLDPGLRRPAICGFCRSEAASASSFFLLRNPRNEDPARWSFSLCVSSSSSPSSRRKSRREEERKKKRVLLIMKNYELNFEALNFNARQTWTKLLNCFFNHTRIDPPDNFY
jgi:hypothetical protein